MPMSLTCNQVNALLPFYINDKLNDSLKSFVKEHLEICPSCRAKFEALKKVISSLSGAHREIDERVRANFMNPFSEEQYMNFKRDLCAYVDNELSDEEGLRMKKYAISNPLARIDLENMYTLKKLLHNSFEKTKTEVKYDFSKFIKNQAEFQKNVTSNEPALTIVTLFFIVTAIFAIGAVLILWA